MLVSFEVLSADSKIWIYQSGRELSEKEKSLIIKKSQSFLTEWTAHGHDLAAAVKIFFDRFIILAVDESKNDASGCSIDKSIHFIGQLGQTLNMNLLDKTSIAFQKNDQIHTLRFNEIKKMIEAGMLTESTPVFNHAITSKKELEEEWLLPAEKSWIKRYF